jgi:hypothetical protein
LLQICSQQFWFLSQYFSKILEHNFSKVQCIPLSHNSSKIRVQNLRILIHFDKSLTIFLLY